MKILIICFLIFLFSCSNNSIQVNDENIEKTLRSLSVKYENSVNWVDGTEIEQNDVSNQELITNTNETLDYAFHTIKNTQNIYPSIKNFTILDTENIPASLYTKITEFLDSLKAKSINTQYFSSKHEYLKTLTEYNLQDYPQIQNYYIGKTTKINNTYEIPVRLLFENQYANCKLYWTIENTEYKIVQADIGDVINE